MRQSTVRSFPTKCKRCGKPVLYWDGSAGSKVFFDYPVYGKPMKHYCLPTIRNRSNVIETHNDHQRKLVERSEFQCPVCQKVFQTESALEMHINKMRKQDDYHYNFFDQLLDLIDFDDDEPHDSYRKGHDLMENRNVKIIDRRKN